ncbi:MBL fold metallo-hydrolase [Rhizobium sp. WYJ-E13]|uniref:MBL fold metallo-hydrolase n=1 Tax=Rhizobium sp. WYJ-E13 TaxID=2849093 RepID=UPI001C1E93BD|nr:MBL fold metallo-hydrolase [Rhizobium sp. WYJ-E13]QWW72303.1 MBL fold metallo-hydrolase [Rhizobium sp. WYJ-E13]
MNRPEVVGFFDRRTSSIQYVVIDTDSASCAIIDPVLDFDARTGNVTTENADKLIEFVSSRNLSLQWILDTHPHADHFTASHYLKEKTGAMTAIGAHITDVQRLWAGIYAWPDFVCDGSQWDRLFRDGEVFSIGTLSARVMHSPGHTLASVTYLIDDCAFVHDTLFMPDSGTARADFPGGSAEELWETIQKILALPDETRVFVGHDYQPGGREPQWETTVAREKAGNIHLLRSASEGDYVALRQARDKTLPMPELIFQALQVNIAGGRLPDVDMDGKRYFKLALSRSAGDMIAVPGFSPRNASPRPGS